MQAEIAVAVNTEPGSIPAQPKILGFTAKIYAIVIKDVKPARSSVFTFVLFSLK